MAIKTIAFVRGLSEKEKERRWQQAREFMRSRELDALLLLAGDDYLSGWVPGNAVIFPLKGEPLLMFSFAPGMASLTPETPKEERPWIKNISAGARGAMIVAALKEKGLDRSRVGVLGLAGVSSAGPEGGVSYATWHRVVSRLPDCKFEDIARDWSESILVKSEEELAHVRRAAQVLEEASIAQLEATRPGATDLDVWAAIKEVLDKNGVYSPMLILRSTPDAASWGAGPNWLHGIGTPRALKPGDIVLTELFADSAGLQAQTQMASAIPPVSPEDQECARLARLSYEAGLRMLRPGNTFEQVVAAMEEPLNLNGKDSKVWYLTPLIHTMNPQACVGATGVHFERMPGVENYPQYGSSHTRGGEVVLKPGMVIELEPNACIGRHRVNIGGTVLVTGKGPEELNNVPCQMRLSGKT
ncbi:MAG: aminopeptidase P family protein [Chloroflexi bacterium]|nr:aminopeptidase P family protein [Chloroflexota bacterium]